MAEDAARRLVAEHLDRARPAGDRTAGSLRDVPPIELFLPPAGPQLVEETAGDAPPHGFAVADGVLYDLGEERGVLAFLRGPGVALDPLALVLVVARYRLPALVGGGPVLLVTAPSELHPAVAGPDVPVDLSRDGDAIVFTTQAWLPAAGGGTLVAVDRWRLVIGGAAALDGEALRRTTVGRGVA